MKDENNIVINLNNDDIKDPDFKAAQVKFNLAQFKIHNLPLTDKEILSEYETRKDEFDYVGI